MTNSTSAHSRQHEIEKVLSSGFATLKFPKKLEEEFLQDYAKTFLFHMRMALILALVLFVLNTGLDFYFMQQRIPVLFFRSMVILPILLAMVFVSFTQIFLRIQQPMMIASVLILTLSVLLIASNLAHPYNEIYFDGLVLIELYTFTIAHIRFWNALFCATFIIVLFNIIFSFDPQSHAYLFFARNYLYIAGAIVGLFVNYLMEKNARKQFLITELNKVHSANLLTLANLDGLTGVANRRSFDIALKREWQIAARLQYPITLFLIDIDYFKEYNDAYGHQVGDTLLITIADKLKIVAKRAGDLVARYGGDEFAIILLNTQKRYAKQVADNLIHKIQALKIPHKKSKTEQIATVTIGLASIIPNVYSSPAELFKRADDALYKAKSLGRNNVVAFEK